LIPFAKLQGAGNGYVLIDGRERSADWAALARAIGRPAFGVGSDGLAIVEPSDVAAVRMRIFNSDGSESEMRGNGIRLFAKFVLDRALAELDAGVLAVETGGGVRHVEPRFDAAGRVVAARVAMGEPVFAPEAVPVDPSVWGTDGPVIEQPVAVAGMRLRLTCLAIGNPHAVALLDEPVDDFPLAAVGEALMGHAAFPNRVNFEIVNVLDRGTVRARIFERGEGETLASGTGSTAAMIAARLAGRVGDEVAVRLRGGVLRVAWPGAGEARLEGPAEEVFTGSWPEAGQPRR